MSSEKLTSSMVRISDLLAVLLAAFVVTVRPMFSGLTPPLHRNILIYLLVSMSALLVTLAIALRKRVQLRAPTLTGFLLAFMAIAAITAFRADDRFGAIVRMLDILAWCVLTIVLIQLISTPFRGRILLAALVATLAVLAVNGFYEYFVGLPRTLRGLPEDIPGMVASGTLHPKLIGALRKRAAAGEVFGTFVIANSFAGYLILILPAAFGAALAIRRERGKRLGVASIVVGAAALAGLAVLFLTKSKGGILAFVLALALGAVLPAFLRTKRRKCAATAAVVLVALLLTAQGPPTDDNATIGAPRKFWLGDSAEVRVEYWKGSWEIVKRHPLLGVGPGNFSDHYLKHRAPEGSETRYAHNDYLEIAVEMGSVGLALYLGIWVTWFLTLRRKAPKVPPPDDEDRKSRRAFAILIGAVGVAAILFAMSEFIPTAETGMMILVAVAVWLVVYATQALHLLRLEGPGEGQLLRRALLLGGFAFLLHSAIDFDFNVPGITRPLAAVLVVALAFREPASEKKPRRFGTGGQIAFTAFVAVPMVLVLWFLLYPLIDMSVAVQRARAARMTHVQVLREAAEARRRSDLGLARQREREAAEILSVELPGHLRKAIEEFPANVEPYLELAWLEAGPLRNDPTGDRQKLETLLKEAKRLRPGDPRPYAMLAQILSSQMEAAEAKGQTKLVRRLAARALTEIDGAVERYPTDPGMRRMRAGLLERLSRRAEAAEEYRKALDFAARTSEKELKFSPEEIAGIELTIKRLEATTD